MNNDSKIAVLSFYSFTNLENLEILLPKILLIGKKRRIRGTILLAPEGFNGSISGTKEEVNFLVDEIIKLTSAEDVNIKINYCDIHPFQKLKVKLKKEIIAMTVGDIDIANLKGEYIEPKDWDKFISQNNVVLVDTRNDYEVCVGTFKGAIDPKTETFKQFPKWVEQNKELLAGKKVAMFCTGGIRCEKSTAYLKKLGFNDVYHLKGGILQYLEVTHNRNRLWQGECFVFDDRRAVASDLSPAEGHWLERGDR
ncbi:rhodanese-like domain-containing protein [Candidatus Tisiphia endosymbiont of Nedyus quadrimaculatus]|uniref:oxygen-dependent tRNA uridine(34) hydroxylase TrhO n=1 Tax=Candidatus Tisiphia endosymbiont of Nedyus quadrimaculatus TaxID=3139332 RepID=UPI00345E2A3B